MIRFDIQDKGTLARIQALSEVSSSIDAGFRRVERRRQLLDRHKECARRNRSQPTVLGLVSGQGESTKSSLMQEVPILPEDEERFKTRAQYLLEEMDNPHSAIAKKLQDAQRRMSTPTTPSMTAVATGAPTTDGTGKSAKATVATGWEEELLSQYLPEDVKLRSPRKGGGRGVEGSSTAVAGQPNPLALVNRNLIAQAAEKELWEKLGFEPGSRYFDIAKKVLEGSLGQPAPIPNPNSGTTDRHRRRTQVIQRPVTPSMTALASHTTQNDTQSVDSHNGDQPAEPSTQGNAEGTSFDGFNPALASPLLRSPNSKNFQEARRATRRGTGGDESSPFSAASYPARLRAVSLAANPEALQLFQQAFPNGATKESTLSNDASAITNIAAATNTVQSTTPRRQHQRRQSAAVDSSLGEHAMGLGSSPLPVALLPHPASQTPRRSTLRVLEEHKEPSHRRASLGPSPHMASPSFSGVAPLDISELHLAQGEQSDVIFTPSGASPFANALSPTSPASADATAAGVALAGQEKSPETARRTTRARSVSLQRRSSKSLEARSPGGDACRSPYSGSIIAAPPTLSYAERNAEIFAIERRIKQQAEDDALLKWIARLPESGPKPKFQGPKWWRK
jgi:hypothetical protein